MMKNKFLKTLGLILVVICGLIGQEANAQTDPHFSQYYAYPMWLNPSLTGVIDGDFRLTANYKQQWSSVMDPYRTMAVSFDSYPKKNLAFGGTIINQSAGDGGWNYLNALGSAAYHALLDQSKMNVLSIGLQAGMINRHFNPNKLRLGEQWSPIVGYDPGAPTGEHFDQTSLTDLDANFGVFFYNRNPNNRVNIFTGMSFYHLTRPKDLFYENSNGRLPIRTNIHGGARVRISRQINLTPEFIYSNQGDGYGSGRAHEFVGTIYVQYMLGPSTDLLFGIADRWNDAIIPFIGFHANDFTVGLNYDINTSGLKAATMNQGGLELSLSYTKHKKIADPQFICPRL